MTSFAVHGWLSGGVASTCLEAWLVGCVARSDHIDLKAKPSQFCATLPEYFPPM